MSYYDREGSSITLKEWERLFADKDYQVVKQTSVGNLLVSTVWLGVDHGFDHSDEPVIFETMVFGTYPEETHRYSHEQNALAHHDQIVEQLRVIDRALS